MDGNVTVGDFNTPLSIMDRIINQKISKETEDLKNTIDQLDLTNIYKTLYPTIHVLKCVHNILQDRYVRPQNKS